MQVSVTTVVYKCALHGLIYIWDLKGTIKNTNFEDAKETQYCIVTVSVATTHELSPQFSVTFLKQNGKKSRENVSEN